MSRAQCPVCGRYDCNCFDGIEISNEMPCKPQTVTNFECITCYTQMLCVDDVNYETHRMDFLECPKCHSKAEVTYGNHGKFVTKFNWKRD